MDELASRINITFLFKPKTEFQKIPIDPKIFLPMSMSIALLIVSVIINLVFYDYTSNIFMEQGMDKNENFLALTISSLLTFVLFVIESLLLASYLFLSIRIFNHYAAFKEWFSLVLFVSIVKSLGQLLEAFNSTQHLNISTKLAELFTGNWLLEGISRPFELFNIWSLVLLYFGIRQIVGLSAGKTVFIIGLVVVFDSVLGVGWSFITDIFSTSE